MYQIINDNRDGSVATNLAKCMVNISRRYMYIVTDVFL